MKKKLFAIILSVAILLSTVAGLSEVSFAQDEKYVLSVDGEDDKIFTSADKLITYMNNENPLKPSKPLNNFDESKLYTLTLYSDLKIPNGYRTFKTLEIHCNLTIEGNGYTIMGGNPQDDGFRLIDIKLTKGKVTIKNLTFDGSANNYPTNAGIELYNDNKEGVFNITIDSCHFKNCYTVKHQYTLGGAIDFSFKEAADKSKSVNIINSTFNNCKAAYGGAIYIGGQAELSLEDTSISKCSATMSGGAISTYGAKRVEIKSKNKRSSIKSCYAWFHGGAIDMNGPSADKIGTLVISNYEIKDCKAEAEGGAISKFGRVEIDHLTIENCKGRSGGAIWGSLLTGFIKNSKFINNAARYENGIGDFGNMGGAIYNDSTEYSKNAKYEKLVIEASEFDGNMATLGGAIFSASPYSGVEIKDGTVVLNNESLLGGAIFLLKGTMDIENTEIKNNKVIIKEDRKTSGRGAAIYAGPSYPSEAAFPRTLNISEGSVITDNHAVKFGGGIYSYKGEVNIDNSTIEKKFSPKWRRHIQ